MRASALAIAALAISIPAWAGPVDDAIKQSCSKGDVWRLPLPPPGWPTIEVPIKVDGKPAEMVRICNCTPDVAGKTTGVWVRTYPSDAAVAHTKQLLNLKDAKPQSGGGVIPYYLPNLACIRVGTATIILAPVDKVETWGTSLVENPAKPAP